MGRSEELSGSSGPSCSFCPVVSFMLRGRSGGSSVRWPLFAFLRIRRPARTEGRAPGGVYAGSDPAVAVARAGRAGQFLKNVNWNGSPMKISRPPGIVAANA